MQPYAAHTPGKALTLVLLRWAQAAQKAPTEELSKHQGLLGNGGGTRTEQAAPGPSDKPAAGLGTGWAARMGDNLEELFRHAQTSAAGVLHRVWAPRAWTPRAS